MPILLYQQLAEPIWEPQDFDTSWFFECPIAPPRPKLPNQGPSVTFTPAGGGGPDSSQFIPQPSGSAVLHKWSGGGGSIAFTPMPDPDSFVMPLLQDTTPIPRQPRLPISEYRHFTTMPETSPGPNANLFPLLQNYQPIPRIPKLPIWEYMFVARDPDAPPPPPPGVATGTQIVYAGTDGASATGVVYAG